MFCAYVEVDDGDDSTQMSNNQSYTPSTQNSLFTPKTHNTLFSSNLARQQTQQPDSATNKSKGGASSAAAKKDCGNLSTFHSFLLIYL